MTFHPTKILRKILPNFRTDISKYQFCKLFTDQETLKQQLIIVTIILVLIISGNIWFIWYKRNIEQENMAKLAEKNGQDINSLNNADKNSFTSRAPVLDNQESIYCSLDDI